MTNAFIKAILISLEFYWSISNLLFKVAMFIGKKSHAALQWSEQGYNIEFRWEQGAKQQTEHLNIELVNGDIRLDLKSNPHIQILEPATVLCGYSTEHGGPVIW